MTDQQILMAQVEAMVDRLVGALNALTVAIHQRPEEAPMAPAPMPEDLVDRQRYELAVQHVNLCSQQLIDAANVLRGHSAMKGLVSHCYEVASRARAEFDL